MIHVVIDLFTAIEWTMIAHWLVTGLYLLALIIASIYGLHRYWLVWVQYRTAGDPIIEPKRFETLPVVTVQLPMFNESQVARRIIEATCQLDYPAELLQIQVLDDSTDESASIARQAVSRMQRLGHDIVCLHRADRRGYKAGALEAGLAEARGELIAVFDADFLPPRDFLHRTIHHFTDEKVGMVQAAWDHLNRDDSLLTRAQAIYLDSHFQIEHTARNRSGHWINFNGTAGIWRREAITDAGGWQHDTITEDVDLSYRAQLAGWDFIYLPTLYCPAELPDRLPAFKTQQHRWVKGTVQTAMKLLPTILRAPIPIARKVEAWFHLTSPIVYPCVIAIVLLMLPAVLMNTTPFVRGSIEAAIFGLVVLMLATTSGCLYYIAGQRVRKRLLLPTLAQLPVLIALGVGMSLNNTRAVIEALLGHQSPFLRTPKGQGEKPDATTLASSRRRIAPWLMPLLEWTTAGYLIYCLALAWQIDHQSWSLPFLALFAAGFAYICLQDHLPYRLARRLLPARPLRHASSSELS